jgi:predicted amidophosphoribosyltransferase
MPTALTRSVLSLLVPPLCACCGEPEPAAGPLCGACRSRLVALPGNRCARCGAPAGPGVRACPECRGRALAFRSAWAAFAYDGAGRGLVAALKRRGMLSVAAFMGAELAARAPEKLLGGTLVPVPAHSRRWLSHGFNPAASLAAATAAVAGLPVSDLLARAGPERTQTGLGRSERLRSAGGEVRLRRRARLPPGALVLVDDVYTTGATLDACARKLRSAGADRVLALTFARTTRL